MLALKILAFVFLIPGVSLVMGARAIVPRLRLDEKMKCDFEHEMNESELASYKLNRAVVNLKMLGMLIALPGFILALVSFR